MSALEREARQELLGTFNPAMWAPTFPERTAELVERYRAIVAVALADYLPPVLANMVAAYL
jgi:hypothetical protein